MTKYVKQRGLQIVIVLNELLTQRIFPGSNLEPAALCVPGLIRQFRPDALLPVRVLLFVFLKRAVFRS